MLIVMPGDRQRHHHADQRQRQRHQDRQRIDERAELHDENQVHQQHRESERRENLAEHLGLRLGVAADRVVHAGRQPHLVEHAIEYPFVTSPAARPDVFSSTVTTGSRFK